MHIIVVGCGKVGAKFAEILSLEGHDVAIIDNDSNAFKALGSGFGGITVTGVPIDQDILKQAGIETADAVAVVTPDDNVNVMVSQVAKEIFKVPKVIARIYNPSREHVFHAFGLETICPTELTVDVIHAKLLGENDGLRHTIGSADFVFRHEKLQKSYEGKKIESIKTDRNESVFGVVRNGNFEFANGAMVLNKEDILVIARKE